MRHNPKALLAVAALSSFFAFAPATAGADSCPNAAIRQQQQSTYLPQCRAFEQVSPIDKNGTDVQNWIQIGADGEAFAWVSLGGYAEPNGTNIEVPYVGRRGPDGWRTTAFSPAFGDDVRPTVLTNLGGYAFSSNLSELIFISSGGFDPADIDGFGQFGALDLYRIEGDAGPIPTWVSHGEDGISPESFNAARLSAVSPDGSSVFFTSADPLTAAVPPTSTASLLYRWRNGQVEAVGVDGEGALLAGGSALVFGENGSNANIGAGHFGQMPDTLAISADGSRYVYGGRVDESSPAQLYLAVDGAGSQAISLSQKSGSVGDPASADVTFMTATPGLGKVYFQTTAQLTDDAPEGGGDYVYDTASGVLAFSNPDDSYTGGFFSISGLSKVSDDGAYLYFVSTAVLDDGAEAEKRNLYVRHEGVNTLIAILDEGDYGVSMVPRDNSVTNTDYTHAGLSADGTRFVFESKASLGGFASGGYRQIYSYDAVNGSLGCVSCRSDGSVAEGDATLAPPTETYKPTPRGISAAGETIVFTTSDPLAATDSDEANDVYEAHDGVIRLLSSGTSAFGSTLIGMSEQGRDVFFMTRSSLVPGDSDNGLNDIYDARAGGGFAVGPKAVACEGEGCQSAAATPPRLAMPGDSRSRGNVRDARSKPRKCAKGSVKKRVNGKAKCVKKHRRAVRNGRGR